MNFQKKKPTCLFDQFWIVCAERRPWHSSHSTFEVNERLVHHSICKKNDFSGVQSLQCQSENKSSIIQEDRMPQRSPPSPKKLPSGRHQAETIDTAFICVDAYIPRGSQRSDNKCLHRVRLCLWLCLARCVWDSTRIGASRFSCNSKRLFRRLWSIN